MEIQNPYKPRPTAFLGFFKADVWQFKLYSITDNSNLVPSIHEWENAKQLILNIIENYLPANCEEQLGYVIYHKGFDSNYIVISWWAYENMLRMFAYSSDRLTPHDFYLVQDGLNICVWDMLIHNHERNAYVKHILANNKATDIKGYLNENYTISNTIN